jgi:hypothetical protein
LLGLGCFPVAGVNAGCWLRFLVFFLFSPFTITI